MTDGPLNIEVLADPATCRTSSTGVDALASGVGGLGSAFGSTGASSEGFWRGGAGPPFRNAMSNAKGNASQVEHVAATLARALHSFADEIDTVKARMAQARQVASAAGLHVSDTEIQPPGPAPGPAPAAPSDESAGAKAQHEQAMAEHQAAVDDHQRKVAAFNEATATVSDARGKERAAHEALRQAASDSNGTLDTLRTVGEKALPRAVALVGGLSGASHKLLLSAQKNQALGTWASAMLVNDSRLSAGEKLALLRLRRVGYQEAAKAGFQKAGIDKIVGRLPGKLGLALRYNASDLVKDALRLDKGVPEAFQKGIPVLKRLPVAGTVLTAGLTAADIHNGADPTKSIEKAVGATAGGMAVSAGLDAAVGAAAAAGLAVPGPGWVVAGSIIGGAAVAEGVGYVVDHYGDQINHAVGDAAGHVADAGKSAVHGVENAGKAVGHAVGKIF